MLAKGRHAKTPNTNPFHSPVLRLGWSRRPKRKGRAGVSTAISRLRAFTCCSHSRYALRVDKSSSSTVKNVAILTQGDAWSRWFDFDSVKYNYGWTAEELRTCYLTASCLLLQLQLFHLNFDCISLFVLRNKARRTWVLNWVKIKKEEKKRKLILNIAYISLTLALALSIHNKHHNIADLT